MPEPTVRPDPCVLQATALRYAARDLSPSQCEAFEARLADDQSARDALAEAVRLSAAAIGQHGPEPDRGFRALIRERVHGLTPNWLARHVYRGHPLAWAASGAAIVAAATLVALQLSGPFPVAQDPPQSAASAAPTSPAPSDRILAARPDVGSATEPVVAEVSDDSTRKAAELWAELSTPDHVEKTHEDEARLHQRFKSLHMNHPNHLPRPTSGFDSRE